MITTPAPRTQSPAEPLHLYGLHLIAYCLEHGPGLLSDDQLEIAIHFYPMAVHRIEPRQAEALAKVRRRMTNSQTARQEQAAARDRRIQAWIDAASQDASQSPQELAQADQDQTPPDPRDQAIRLLRAALQMIQDPGTTEDQGGGGSRVPVNPRPPKFPPAGAQAIPPRPASQAPSKPEIVF